MKKIMSFVFASAVAVLGSGAVQQAQAAPGCGAGRTPGVNHRQHRQQRRIGQGARSGELTRREFLRLEREQSQIQRKEFRAKADGEVTRRERARLQRELNQSSRHIYRAKHNDRDRN